MKLKSLFTIVTTAFILSAPCINAQQVGGDKHTKVNAAGSPPKISTTCNPTATNVDFEQGTLNGWNAFYAANISSATFFDITGLTGGACGPVKKSAFNGVGSTYMVHITSGSGYDPIVPSIPVVSPFGGKYSVMIGDSTGTNAQVAVLSQQFTVSASTRNFKYAYAFLFQNPTGHAFYTQPFMTITFFDQNGDTIQNCSKKLVVSQDTTNPIYPFDSTVFNGTRVFYQNWTQYSVSLSAYIGQCVTVEFKVADCAFGNDFGYAYVDASVSPLAITASSPSFCGQKYITLTAPVSTEKFKWTGPAGGIVGADTLQTITVDSAGTYTLILLPGLNSGSCVSDTLMYTLGITSGPVPQPNFTAGTSCSGRAITFTNTSNPLAGSSFYWDFYGSGYYQDSSLNPTWVYGTGGNHIVKLHEVHNGCGADTLITVHVDTTAVANFTYSPTCPGVPVSFTNTSTVSTNYKWNFGDTASGSADSSSLQSPVHTYNTSGTYTVTLVAFNGSPCSDTITQMLSVYPLPKPVITGTDTICSGSSTSLYASCPGATAWSWAPTTGVSCPTCPWPFFSPTLTTTYTITTSNGGCTSDTTVTIHVRLNPPPHITAFPSDTICPGDSVLLVASGGCTYVWTNTGSTVDSIWVKPSVTQQEYLQSTCNGCTDSTKIQITVNNCTNAVKEISRQSINVTLYPVPAQNNVALQFGSPVHNEKYQVINTLGQVVDEGVISGTKYMLNISSYASGMYLVHLADDKGLFNTEVKFIKQ